MTDTATTVNMDPLVLSSTTAISGNRDATPALPGGARDGVFGMFVMGAIMGAKALGITITDAEAIVIVGLATSLFTGGRKLIANARVKHGK